MSPVMVRKHNYDDGSDVHVKYNGNDSSLQVWHKANRGVGRLSENYKRSTIQRACIVGARRGKANNDPKVRIGGSKAKVGSKPRRAEDFSSFQASPAFSLAHTLRNGVSGIHIVCT